MVQPVESVSPGLSAAQALPLIVFLPLCGGRPSLDFVNTIDWRLHPAKCRDRLLTYLDLLAFCLRLDLISVETYTALAAQAERLPGDADQAISEARSFREALTAIIDDSSGRPGGPSPALPCQKALTLFDSFRRRARVSEALLLNGRQMVPVPQSEREGLDQPWLLLVRDADELLRSPLAERVRVCAAWGCGRAFLDGSKNGGRRWCSMRLCGNRQKAARFRSRQSGGDVPRGTSPPGNSRA